ncbi:HEAVY METAL-ASSOCIATED ISOPRENYLATED PLANT PROTEIN 7 [Salix purpurea]|uniref:HEAVY METAL-ASSOCIATED ISOPRENYLATED PLANT PROTEIN 7 n=1 Tax=Salix purpurea TaxID=77065 RepID=A0A9Q0U8Q2_SALPP|nr:HEAVY METAL-ASSOCIATED ISOPRENYLATED PLANT PROTEIN 7 [Salix purpurea]
MSKLPYENNQRDETSHGEEEEAGQNPLHRKFQSNMANEKKREELKVVTVEFNISMHCNACERTVAKIISKFKGVETFRTDMNKHKVVVTGRIDPQKLLKKLKNKTGKKVEILANKREEEGSRDTGENAVSEAIPRPVNDRCRPPISYDCCENNDLLMFFSDENPNACSIM